MQSNFWAKHYNTLQSPWLTNKIYFSGCHKNAVHFSILPHSNKMVQTGHINEIEFSFWQSTFKLTKPEHQPFLWIPLPRSNTVYFACKMRKSNSKKDHLWRSKCVSKEAIAISFFCSLWEMLRISSTVSVCVCVCYRVPSN